MTETADRTVVRKPDIVRALQILGVLPGDILLIHSSMKSFGYVAGGPLAVIEAAMAAVTGQGTVVFPTLVQRDFAHAYINWDKARSPSDVGLISETFRRMAGTVRSDQATHSVAAWGRQADELTRGHTAYGPRMGTFGDYSFSYSSPWQKLYLYGARICFMGVDTRSNTFKHFVEYCLMETLLKQIADPRLKCLAMAEVKQHNKPGIWPYIDSAKAERVLGQQNLITQARCGDAVLTSFKADDFYQAIYPLVLGRPQDWFNPEFLAWHERYCGAT